MRSVSGLVWFVWFAVIVFSAFLANAADMTFDGGPSGMADLTDRLQTAIDRVAESGGGRLRIVRGTYPIGPIDMRSGVVLFLEDDVTLVGSTNILDYTSRGNNSLIRFRKVENAAIEGAGCIDGNGGAWPRIRPPAPEDYRPRTHVVDLRESRNVRIEGVRVRAGGSWTIHAKRCDGVIIRGIDLLAHRNACNDGIDMESKNVLIENCRIDADDDGIVFKASERDIVVENVIVRNCRVSSSCAFIKFGTETKGCFRNVCVSNCVLTPPSSQARFDWRKHEGLFGVKSHLVGLSGITVEMVDGGRLEDVTFRDVEITGATVPVFVRLGRRRTQDGVRSCLRNVLIENVRGVAASRVACSITGVPGSKVEGVTLRNVDLTFLGGGTAGEACAAVPEAVEADPECYMFGCALPAYGFYVRHAEGVVFEDVHLRLAKGCTDARPDVVTDDARLLRKEK